MILGIESSCDETAAALVDAEGGVHRNIIASQLDLHGPYGGVVPELASRAHLRAILPVVESALGDLSPQALSGIAATNGPGLTGSLLIGTQMAKTLAWVWRRPLVAVNHLHAHLLAPFLHPAAKEAGEKVRFPYVALLASGGHTALYRVESFDRFLLLGQTRDDAAGEAFDKAAKILGLGYPGGPLIDRYAAQGDPYAIDLPRPLLRSSAIEFSFSGLKTALAQRIAKEGMPRSEDALADYCASFQRVVVESLVQRTMAAALAEKVGDLALTGGVAANRGLRAALEKACAPRGMRLHCPAFEFCTDNAAMVAFAGWHALQKAGDQGMPEDALEPYSRDPERKRGRFLRPS